MKNEILKTKLARVYQHIMSDCGTNVSFGKKGMIIADDENGEVLGFVKSSLNYDELTSKNKVFAISIDKSWDAAMTKSASNVDTRECRNRLVAAAYKANHGLLVLNVSNIKLFSLCWHLKQLAKQEEGRPMLIWPADDVVYDEYTEKNLSDLREELSPVCPGLTEEEDLFKLIKGFQFDGYVLINIGSMKWSDVKDYATEQNPGEFEAMMSFYSLI